MATSSWGKSWGKAWGAAWGAVGQITPAQPIQKDPYRAIASAVFNLRVDGPGNAIYTRIAMRRPRRK